MFDVFKILLIILSLNLQADMLSKTQNQSAIKNHLPAKKLQILKQKLQKQKDFKIRIYGDSHIAADFFPNVLRTKLFKANAIGFAYPIQPKYQQHLQLKYTTKDFEVLNSKNPNQANFNYPLGGVIARAKKKGASITLETSLQTQKFKIGFLFKAPQTTNAFSIKGSDNKSYELRSSKANTWSYKELELSFPLKLNALQKDAELGGYYITKTKNNLLLDTLAINGAKSDLWLMWNEKILDPQLKLLKSDLIILAYGSNDALIGNFQKQKFKENFKKWLKILKSANKDAVFMLISPPTITQKKANRYIISPDFAIVRSTLYELAKEEKMLLFDMHKFMQDSGGKKLWIKEKLSLEDVHLSVKGYELMGEKMIFDLKKLLK